MVARSRCALLVGLLAAACSKGSPSPDAGTSVPPGPVLVSPSSISLSYGDTEMFSASGGTGVGYVWSINPNCSLASIDQTGLYTAGPLDGTDTVIATDSLGNSGSAVVMVGNGGIAGECQSTTGTTGATGATGATGTSATGTPGTWTALVYINADNASEPRAVQELGDMATAQIPGDAGVAVLVEMGRQGTYSSQGVGGVAAWKGARRFEVGSGELAQLQDLGATDMASPATLSAFIGWGLTTAPATNVLLVVMDQGAGWRGLGLDEVSGNHLDAVGLAAGLTAGLKAGATPSVSVLALEAGLMSNLEVLAQVAPAVSGVVIAPEDLLPSSLWGWSQVLGELGANPATSPAQVGGEVATEAWSRAQAEGVEDGFTLAVVDAPSISAVEMGTNQVAAALLSELTTVPQWQPIALARARSLDLGSPPGLTAPSHTIDLSGFAQQTQLLGVLDAEAAALEAAVGAAVMELQKGPPYDLGAQGISIALPTGAEQLDGGYAALAFADGGSWSPFLSAYGELEQQAQLTGTTAVSNLEVTALSQGVSVSASATSGSLASAYLWVAPGDGGTSVRALLPVQATSAGQLSGSWNGQLVQLSDGSSALDVAWAFQGAWQSTAGPGESYAIPVSAMLPGASAFQPAALLYSLDPSGLTTLQGLQVQEGGRWSPWDLGQGGALHAVLGVAGAGGVTQWVEQTDAGLTLAGAPTLLQAAAPAGDYEVGLGMVDADGAAAGQAAPVPLP